MLKNRKTPSKLYRTPPEDQDRKTNSKKINLSENNKET